MSETTATIADAGTVTATGSSTPIVAAKPVVLAAPGRGADVQVRVSAPAAGTGLPVIVFSHGFGCSMSDYDPLVDFWAAHGFAVVQATHLDSRTLGIGAEDPRTPRIWRFRVEDMKRVLDNLGVIESAVPGLSGRLDHDRVAAAGHSWGAQTASMLLGARVFAPESAAGEDMSDARIKAGVLLGAPGRGGSDLSPFAAEHMPFMHPDFAPMTAPTLVVAGDEDHSQLTSRGPDWFADPYHLSPGPKSLLTLFGAHHSLGGVAGYTVTETTDENPERVALLARLTSSYLRSALDPADSGWSAATAALEQAPDPLGRIESK